MGYGSRVRVMMGLDHAEDPVVAELRRQAAILRAAEQLVGPAPGATGASCGLRPRAAAGWLAQRAVQT